MESVPPSVAMAARCGAARGMYGCRFVVMDADHGAIAHSACFDGHQAARLDLTSPSQTHVS